jgi:hypothetical protein
MVSTLLSRELRTSLLRDPIAERRLLSPELAVLGIGPLEDILLVRLILVIVRI